MAFKNHIKALLLILLVFGAELSAQKAPSPEILRFRETVWLETDRQVCLPGESLQFKAHLYEQDTYQLSCLSAALKCELLDPQGLPLEQLNLVLNQSEAEGVLHLPGDAPSGWYTLRAYTQWMRNFSSTDFARILIKVVNPTDLTSQAGNEFLQPIQTRIYPFEQELVVFMGRDSLQGIGVDAGFLNQSGDTLCHFSTHGSGWARISGIRADEIDRVFLSGSTNRDYEPKPRLFDPGRKEIRVNKEKGDWLISLNFLPPGDKDSVQIFVHQSYQICWQGAFPGSTTEIRIPEELLPKGIFQISITGSQKELYATRLFSKSLHPSHPIGMDVPDGPFRFRNSYSIEVHPDKRLSSYSVFVGLSDPYNPNDFHVPGLPGWSFDYQIPNEEEAFQAWLLCHQYSENLVRALLFGEKPEKAKQTFFAPETRSGVLTGRVIDRHTGKTSAHTGVSLSLLGDSYFDATQTDSSGNFLFSLPGRFGRVDYILNTTDQTENNLLIEVADNFDQLAENKLPVFWVSEDELEFLSKQSVKLQLESIFAQPAGPAEKEQVMPETPDRKALAFYAPPDYRIEVDHYIRLANVREVIYEVVPNVAVRESDSYAYIKVYNDHPLSAQYETLVLLDGIPVSDQNTLLELAPERIEAIEVKNRLYVHGRRIFSSIVNFISPNRDYAGLDLPENSVLKTFLLPTISSRDTVAQKTEMSSSLPNLKSTLLWERSLAIPGKRIIFTTGDASARYRIQVYGFSSDGEWFFNNKIFNLNFD